MMVRERVRVRGLAPVVDGARKGERGGWGVGREGQGGEGQDSSMPLPLMVSFKLRGDGGLWGEEGRLSRH